MVRISFKEKLIIFYLMIHVFFSSLHSKDRRPSLPFFSGDGFRAIADYIYDEEINSINYEKMTSGCIVFVNAYYLDEFISKIHPNIDCKYILISHNSDLDITKKYLDFVNEQNLIKWFAQNVLDVDHPKVEPIPIGITNRYNPLGDPSLLQKYVSYKTRTKSILAYLNVSLHTHSSRKLVLDFFKDKKFIRSICEFISFEKYLSFLIRSKYCLSPRGNELDCHRTWECLYLGTIPIVKSSSMDKLFQGLPVLIVNDWSDVTEDCLLLEYNKLIGTNSNRKILFMSYWENLIKDLSKSFAAQHQINN